MRGNRAGRTGDRRRSVPRECVGLPEVLPETPCCSGDARAAARRGLVQGPDAGAPPRKTLDFRAATNSRRRRRSSVSMEKEWSVSHPRIGSLWRNSAYTRTPPGRSTRSISESARGVLGEVMVGGAGMMDHVEREHDIERMGGVRQREHVRRPEGERRGRMARGTASQWHDVPLGPDAGRSRWQRTRRGEIPRRIASPRNRFRSRSRDNELPPGSGPPAGSSRTFESIAATQRDSRKIER